MSNLSRHTGYNALVNNEGVNYLRREGRLISARKNRYDADAGEIPDGDYDETEGYAPGSELINADGELYKCLTAVEGEAVWIEITAEPVSPSSP